MFLIIFALLIIFGTVCFYSSFFITKKIFNKRTLSYLSGGATNLIIYLCMILNFNKSEYSDKIVSIEIILSIILCIILSAVVSLAFYIGEKRALSSGKHCGDFEKDRAARKFTPFSFIKCMKKYQYPFLKDKGILNNLEFEPANKFINPNSRGYKQEVLEQKMTGHILHWIFIFFWYAMVFGIWAWYFMGYGIYWIFVAAIDTFKELYTEQGSKFSFKSAISEIANSEELANGVSTIKNSVQSAGSAVSEMSRKASSAISEHLKEKTDTKKNKKTITLSKDTDNDSPPNYSDKNTAQNIDDTISDTEEIKNPVQPEISEMNHKTPLTISEHLKEKTDTKKNKKTIILSKDNNNDPPPNYSDENTAQNIDDTISDTEEIKNPVQPEISEINHKTPLIISEHPKEKTDTKKHKKTIKLSKDTDNDLPPNYSDENIAKNIIDEIQRVSLNLNIENDFTDKQVETPEPITKPAPVQNHEPNPSPVNTTPSKNKQPENTLPPAPTATSQYKQKYIIQRQKTNPVIIIVIIILVLIIGILGGMLFMMSRNYKPYDPSQSTPVSDIVTTTDNEKNSTESETTTVMIETVTKNHVEHQPDNNSSVTDNNSSVNIPCSKDDVNNSYINIINSMDFLQPYRGFVFDFDNDGINEMIVPDTNEMCYKIYYFDDNSIKSHSFGDFMALDNFSIYKVSGENNENYIYYRDNYSYKSSQGYYESESGDELEVFIDYTEKNEAYSADWTIYFNKYEKYDTGNETVDILYGQSSDCYDTLLSAFRKYGFDISENSKYTEINGLYYDELIDKLSNKTISTQPSTEKKPSISAYLYEKSYYPIADGIDIVLNVSGDYSYYHYEGYYSGGGEFNSLCASGNTSESEIVIKSGSTISSVKVDITPYNANNTAGETISVSYTVTPLKHSVETYSCNSLGQINAHGGVVAGYATSYVVDGGAISEIRHSLGNNWHITAKNMCINYGVTWYELWDSDDGDYYGWVDANYIDFY